MLDIIIQKEEELRQAMLANDVATLDLLIDDSLVFLAPDGAIATKEMDLAAHRTKIQIISELLPSEQKIIQHDNFFIVTVKMSLKGVYAGFDISGLYRYLRVWKQVEDTYKVVSGSVVKIID